MNQYQLQVTAQFRPEVLERVLRLTRHRGFRVAQMDMTTQGANLVINMLVESERAVELLSRQLEKLLDVTLVQVLEEAQALKKIA
ncbi:acetolactate synthase 2 small subunit [Oceanisphaera profunda]|uniref:Acetolactate synthase 2 small subunit n=1 Tax=Oceanisphaera profunda TaxID=1416627 RepID=A0A1Y0D4R7_9GAMM|nr:acetolactate synthase 2 small subunit [Oceanisphaera profunda]ART82509.1 acetolactate synthase 2 small subunit [Oceanisphaera profunda]